MRLWSIHPKYLDSKGLVALWREALLAKKVLEGFTKGYTRHPQLTRFRNSEHALACINVYLEGIYQHSVERGYHFSQSKLDHGFKPMQLKVTSGQIQFERTHLLAKLQKRDKEKFNYLSRVNDPDLHPLFRVTEGPVEIWEIL